MIPPIPTRSRNNRRTRMPTRIPDNSLPSPRITIIIKHLRVPLIALRPRIKCSLQHVDLRFRGTVEVPDVDLAVVRAGVDVALVCGAGGAEVAADESFEYAVAAERYETAVVGVGRVGCSVVGGEAVVETCCVVLVLHGQ
jgi:hypothetical protein